MGRVFRPAFRPISAQKSTYFAVSAFGCRESSARSGMLTDKSTLLCCFVAVSRPVFGFGPGALLGARLRELRLKAGLSQAEEGAVGTRRRPKGFRRGWVLNERLQP